MISLERVRELLGSDADGLSDLELDAIRQDTYTRVGELVTVFEDQQRRRPLLSTPAPPRTTSAETRRSMRLVSR